MDTEFTHKHMGYTWTEGLQRNIWDTHGHRVNSETHGVHMDIRDPHQKVIGLLKKIYLIREAQSEEKHLLASFLKKF